MFRVHRLTIVIVVACLIGAVGFPSPVATPNLTAFYGAQPALAQAEKKKKRRSLFSILFGRKKAKKKAVVKNSKRTKRSKKKTRTAKKSKATAVAAAKAVKKRDNAKVVLVVGDFFAGGLADGLTTALAKVPGLKVVDRSKGLSGFVRNDIVDWAAVLPSLVKEHKPVYIVALLGSNDRQQIRSGGRRLKKLTTQWYAAYGKRVEGLGASLKKTGINYAWVGLPPVRFKSMNKDFLRFNELYGKAAKSRKGQFLDVWDGFSDADGNYSRSGPDVNGQIVLLRSKDGINMTRAGKRRLAYYVESRLQKLFGSEFSGLTGLAKSAIGNESFAARSPEYDPAKTGKTYVVRLDDPTADAGDALAGEKVEVSAGLVPVIPVSGGSAATRAADKIGRVDNYAWPPQDDPSVAPIAVATPASPTPSGLRTTLSGSTGQNAAALQN